MNPKLQFVYPRLVWDEQQVRWMTGWDIRSLEGAMYFMLLLDLQGRGIIRTCPWDGTIFLSDERTRYCALRCQNAHNVQLFRQNTQTKSLRKTPPSRPVGRQKQKTKRKA